MTADALHAVLEATGYLADGRAAPGVYLGKDVADAGKTHRTGGFTPDALWQSNASLAIYFKHEREPPSDDRIAQWRRVIWNRGFAPLLWVISPERIDIYNGFGRPQPTGDAEEHLLRTFQNIEEELNKLDALAGRIAMETGAFLPQMRPIDRRTSVDQVLLSDLATLEHDLTANDLDRADAQGLIGRSIFTQYLVDREIVSCDQLKRRYGYGNLAGILRDHSATERLFDWLRTTFDGDMFPSKGSTLPDARSLRRVANFLDGENAGTGQRTLFPYQFDVIPVELISSIYEQFTRSDPSPEHTGSKMDVFYTPPSLVSLVLDEVMEGLKGRETVLDLSCGSGVFLVEALRRLVALRCDGHRPTREVVRSTLHQQIFGVDISEAAVRVAAFSLYLAALELDPDPKPPEALKFEPLIGKTLFVGDAWEVEQIPESGTAPPETGRPRKFDLIVGNPPWSYPGKSSRAVRNLEKSRSNPSSPRGLSLSFVGEAMRFASENARFGLVLNAVNFFARSKTGADAVKKVIEQLSPVTLVNLSFQSWVFPHANFPAIILLARHRPSPRAEITTVQVPWSPAGERTRTFEISRDDIVTLPLAEWRKKPEFLKAGFFGLPRDLALLDRLTDEHPSLADNLRTLGTKLRAGLKVGNRSRDASFLRDLPLLANADLRPFSVPDGLDSYEDVRAEGPRSREIYRAPLFLVQALLKEEQGGRAVAAVSNQDIVFTDAYFGAALPADQSQTARILAGILNSSLASWFFLMTASTFGLWMQRVLLGDIEHMPIPNIEELPRTNPGLRLARIVEGMQGGSPNGTDWNELDEAVFDLYSLDSADRIVARDGLFRASWQWKRGRIESANASDTGTHVHDYARVFLTTMDGWLSVADQHRLRGEIFEFPLSAALRIVRFALEDRHVRPAISEIRFIEPNGNLRDVLTRIGKRLHLPLGNELIGQRSLRLYGHDEFFIVKPAARRHWTGVSALEDADSVIGDSLFGAVE